MHEWVTYIWKKSTIESDLIHLLLALIGCYFSPDNLSHRSVLCRINSEIILPQRACIHLNTIECHSRCLRYSLNSVHRENGEPQNAAPSVTRSLDRNVWQQSPCWLSFILSSLGNNGHKNSPNFPNTSCLCLHFCSFHRKWNEVRGAGGDKGKTEVDRWEQAPGWSAAIRGKTLRSEIYLCHQYEIANRPLSEKQM